jgi:hypothetical protein
MRIHVLVCFLLLAGIASAGVPAGYHMMGNIGDKADCVIIFANGMAFEADQEYGAPDDVWVLFNELDEARDNLKDYYRDGDLQGMITEYVKMVSAFNQIRAYYLWYGMESIGPDILEHFADYQDDLMQCYEGGLPG